MYKLSFVMVLSVVVFLTPFLGLPSGYQAGILGVLSLCILITTYSVRSDMRIGSAVPSKEDVTESPLSDFSD